MIDLTSSRAIDLAGVAVAATGGALLAGRHRMDVLGALVVAAITAVGGGTLRDVLLDRHPIFWLADTSYLIVITLATVVVFLTARFATRHHNR